MAELGPALLGWGDPAVEAAKQVVRDADLVVFASPTYKATYTGLLKLFLDQFGAGELHGTTAVALMLGAGPQHALAGEYTLKPVLSEIGCSLSDPGALPARVDLGGQPGARRLGDRARDVLFSFWRLIRVL